MDLGLKGKRALVTGASKGIGAAVARSLAKEGCNLYLVARDIERLEALKVELGAMGPQLSVEVLEMDMRAPDASQTVARAAGAIDILINNAGDVPGGTVLEIDEARWRQAWDLKVFGYINLARELYREMTASRHGVIVNIVGTAGERPRGNHIAVASGNAALLAFTRALGLESVESNVRVVAINPGASETDRQIVRWKARAKDQLGDEERWRELVADFPFGRLAKPEEIADVVTFVASDRASYMSGTAVTVDGGGHH
ncbi:SDR family oxidoreductase [Sphingomonas sp. AP4-R1]|uniref:short-chain dehydrogenase/reductase n=1 Tax=Sphingomonas sp. AP4-R1 TaxID=2735134 RepID=UPI00149396A7|nr:short-chain dehydrogenase/reductase [Sphingomonas sp. AP4-R1]QJU58153.1 SDR family oxidoreductase [Sphingomonas sp. AP4-R1]